MLITLLVPASNEKSNVYGAIKRQTEAQTNPDVPLSTYLED